MTNLTNLEVTLKNEITDILDYSYAKMLGWCQSDLQPLKELNKKAQIILKEKNVYLVSGKLKTK